MTIRTLHAGVAGGLMLALCGCWDTHGADEPARQREERSVLHDESEPTGWYCPGGSRTVVDDDQVVPELGFAPNEVFDFAIGHHAAALRWSDDTELSLSPETGASTLEIDIERDGDVELFKPASEFTGHGATCEQWFEIPVRVTLRSDGGALDEAFPATLRARLPNAAFIQVVTAGSELSGALAALLSFEGMELAPDSLVLSLSVSRSNVSGVLDGQWELPATSSPVFVPGERPLAHWGPADCGKLQFAVDLSEPTYGATAQAMLDRLADLVELGLSWSAGDVTKARVAFTSEADGACVKPIEFPTATWAQTSFDGVLELQSDDGRLAGTYPVSIDIQGDSVEPLAQHSMIVRHEVIASEGPFTPADLGFVGVSATEVERPSLSLTLVFEAGGTISADSQIILWRNELVCEPDPPDPDFCTDVFEAAERGTFSL